MDILQQFLENPNEDVAKKRDEIMKYRIQKKQCEKELEMKGDGEYFIISKKWMMEWRKHVNYEQIIGQYYEEVVEAPKPNALNYDLPEEQYKPLLKYQPENHPWNVQIIQFLHRSEFDIVTKPMFDFFASKYGSYEPVIRRGIYMESKKSRVVHANLKRLIGVMLVKNELTHGLIQVDQNCSLSEWRSLLAKSLQVNDVRIWKFNETTSVNQIKGSEIDAKVLQEDLICKMELNLYEVVVIDILTNKKWQFTEVDKSKTQIPKQNTLFNRMMKGCGKPYCQFQYCLNNQSFANNQRLNKDSMMTYCNDLIKKDPYPRICLQSTFPDILTHQEIAKNHQSLQKRLDETLPEGFVGLTNDYLTGLGQGNPCIDAAAIQMLNQLISQGKLPQFKAKLLNILQQKYPYKKSPLKTTDEVLSLFDVRALFFIMLLDCVYDEEIFINLKGFIRVVSSIKQEWKNIMVYQKLFMNCYLFKYTWIAKISKHQFQRIIEQIQQYITISLLEIDDQMLTQKNRIEMRQILGFLELFYYANKQVKFVSEEAFYNQQAENIYPEDQYQEEYLQFRYYKINNFKEFVWTFCEWPWILSAEFKTKILTVEHKVEQHKRMRWHFGDYLKLSVSRSDIVTSTLQKVKNCNPKFLKMPLRIEFIGEQGVDEGGVKREFFALLMQKLVTAEYGMFTPKMNNRILWFTNQSFEMPIQYELIGILLGLAMFNQVHLDLHFPLLVFKKLQGEKLGFEDLKEIDIDLYRSLIHLLEYQKNDIEESFCLYFQASFISWDQHCFEDLLPNGKDIPVNQQNKQQYVDLYVDWYLNKSVEKQFKLFQDGFSKVVDGDAIKLFTGEELSQVICGSPVFNMHALEKVTRYENGYQKESPTIQMFWQVIHSMSEEQQRKFLFFCTGSDRAPVGGLESMKFIIEKHGENTSHLPSAHTCFNVLLLPKYENKDLLKEKLFKAIDNSEGFGLF